MASPEGFFNVKDYGAVGDGVTDDLAALHAARDAAGANGIIYLPPSTYLISAAITPLVGQRWIGASKFATKIILPTGISYNAFNVSAADVTIENLQIDGQRGAQAVDIEQSTNVGVYVTAARCTVCDCWIHDTRGIGVSATSFADDLHVLECHIDGGHTNPSGTTGGVNKGIYCTGSIRPVIKACLITGWSQAIGLWYGANHGLIAQNRILNNYGFEDAAHTVHRSACEDFGDIVATHGFNIWRNNLIDGSTSHCLEIAQGVVGSEFLNNVLRNPGKISNTGKCWEVTGQSGKLTTDILIQGNHCFGANNASLTQDEACAVNGLSHRITIKDNFFYDYLRTSGTGALIIGGTSGNTEIQIVGNSFKNCHYNIWLNSTGDGVLIANNLISGAGGVAIYILAGNGHLIIGNKITSAMDHGIFLLGGARHKVIANNITSLNAAITIQVADSQIIGNDCVGSNAGNVGVIDLPAATALRNTVKLNTVRHTLPRRAIAMSASADYNIVQENTILAGDVLDTLIGGGAHNTIEPNHTATVTKALTLKPLGAQTVGTSQVTVAHGLGYTPTVVEITPTSDGRIWESAAADGTNIYLTADGVGRTAKIYVR